MRLDRDDIERRDFDRALRGYDPEQVHAHLHEVAVAVREFMDQLQNVDGDLPPELRDRLQALGDAARSRGELEAIRLHEDAQRVVADAHAEAQRILDDAKRREQEQMREAAQALTRMVDEALEQFQSTHHDLIDGEDGRRGRRFERQAARNTA